MAAELRLGVSFDLVYFRTQLDKLARIAASEFTAPIKIKLDRQVVDQELNRLQQSFKRRTYTINIGDSAVDAARTRVVDLVKELADLRRAVTTAIVIPIKYETTGSAPGRGSGAVNRGVRSATASQSFVDQITDHRDLQKLYSFAKAAQIPFEQLEKKGKSSAEELKRVLGPAFRAVGTDAKAGLQAGLADSNSALAKAAAALGEDLLNAVKKQLGIASPSREFKKIGEDSGEGLEQGLKIGFGEASDVGVQEIEKLFKRLQKEAKAGSAVLQAIIAGSMSGIVQLPGMGQRGARGSIGPMIRQQRAQVQAERQAQAGGLSALMMGMMGGVLPMGGTPRGAGGSIGPMIRQQRAQVRARNQAQTANSAAMILGMMSGVIPMAPRGALGSIRGLIEQERAKVHERNRPQRIAGIIEALSSASGNLSPAAGVNQRLFTGGAVNPGVLSSGYIGRSAISPKFLNYPVGMPPAYDTGFIEPTAFGSLAAGTAGRYGMTARGPQLPSPPMMTGGIGAGGGSFIPESASRSVNGFGQAISGLTEKVKGAAEKVKGAAGVVRSVLIPTFGDMRKQVVDMNRSIAVSQNAAGSMFYGKYMTPQGKLGMYDFPTSGMMGPSSPLGVINAQSSKFGQYGPSGGWFGGFHNFGGGGGNPPNQPPNQPSGGGGWFGGFRNFGGGGGNPPNQPPNQPPGGGGGGGGFNFGGAASNIGNAVKNLPGKGLVREIGEEFGFATKQVLLFGAAYRGLAFLTSFPAQVGQAVGALQSFRNTLNAISPSAQEAERSNALILELVDKYNVPLQSAREGFTRLYASMQPAGFAGKDIENIFIGITQASATFGLSADKVDRVNYAFAQMASKGQVMSEELKGQLGDVLPGAMAIFAEAAGFEGPAAIQEFSEALEDGQFKGEAMVALLKNVGVVMQSEFGPGAEGAARTFQGVLNRLQNTLTTLYEAFEPAAITFLNAVVVPLTEGIKQVADGFTAFFTGAAAQTAGGFAIAQELEKLRPALDGIVENVQRLIPVFQQAGTIALELGKILLSIAGNPFIGYLLSAYAATLPFTLALQALNLRALIPLIASFVKAVPAFIAYTAATIQGSTANKALQLSMQLTGKTAAATAVQIRTVGLALRTAFATTGIGLVLVGIGLLIEKFSLMNQKLQETREKALGAVQAIRSMSATDARQTEQQAQQAFKTIGALAGRKGPQQQGGDRLVPVSEKELAQLRTVGAIQEQRDPSGQIYVRRSEALSLAPQAQRLQSEASYRQRQLKFEEQQGAAPLNLQPVLGAGNGESERKGKRERQLRDFQSEAIAQLRLNEKLAQQNLDQQRQAELIDETEYEIASANNKRKFELLVIDEALAQKAAEIGEFKIDVREKQLAVFQQLAENERLLVNQEADTAIKGARLKLARPFKEAIRDENIEIANQLQLIDNLKAGYSELTPEQQANFVIEQKIKDLRVSQRRIIETEIENLRQVTIERIRGAQALAREAELLKLRNQAAQLRAPLGQERLVELLQQPGTTSEEAQEQFNLEEQNRKLALTKQAAADLAGTINSSVGNALSALLTDFNNLQEVGLNFLRSIADGFKQLADTIIQEATRAFINNAVSKLFGFIAPALGAVVGGAGSLFSGDASISGGGFGPFDGGSFSVDTSGTLGQVGANLSARPFANGGIVTGPTLGLVGEGRFNEAVVPLPNGKSIPVDLGNGAGNNISTNIVVNVNNGQTSSQVNGAGGQALGRELEGAVRSVILKEARPGGIIYNAR